MHCTIARICIKIVHVVKVLRVRVEQFGGVTRCGETRVWRTAGMEKRGYRETRVWRNAGMEKRGYDVTRL